MITDYAQMTVKLSSLMANEQAKNALNEALSTYPLYKGKKDYDLIPTREQLNEKILNHYKYREIGFETVGRFLDELKITMCEIMPYYNELFRSVEIMSDIEDPFGNVDVTETFEETRIDSASSEGQTTSTSTNTGKTETSDSRTNDTSTESNATATNKNKFSDTPQNNVDNINNYLTEYREENNTTNGSGSETVTSEGEETTTTTDSGQGTATTTGTSESTGTTRHTFTKKGNQGVNTYAHDMNEFRTSIIDVVDRIIHDNRLAELFMLVW